MYGPILLSKAMCSLCFSKRRDTLEPVFGFRISVERTPLSRMIQEEDFREESGIKVREVSMLVNGIFS